MLPSQAVIESVEFLYHRFRLISDFATYFFSIKIFLVIKLYTITTAVAPLVQPFADVLAKALGEALESNSKTVDFSDAQETDKRKVNFASA